MKRHSGKRLSRRPAWNWAISGIIEAQDDGSGGLLFSTAPLVPVGRIKWLCDTRGYDSITHVSTLLWLSLIIAKSGSGDAPNASSIPPMDAFIIKTAQDEQSTEPIAYLPYQAPTQPSAYTSWYTGGEQEDGLDPFLWTHHFDPFPFGSVVDTFTPSFPPVDGVGNTTNVLQTGAFVQNTIRTGPQFHPDVVVRSRRKMTRDEGLNLGMSWTSLGNAANTGSQGILFSLAFQARMLLR